MVDFAHIRYIFDRLNTLVERKERVTAKAYGSSHQLTGMPHGTSTESRVESCAIQLASIDQSIEKYQIDLASQQWELQQLLPTIRNPVYKKALKLRYIDGKKIGEIAVILGYSDSHTYCIMRKAEEIINKQKL